MNNPPVTIEQGVARCPYCDRVIGSPLALVDGPQCWGPWIIKCPACGRRFRLKRHREMVEKFMAQGLDEHQQ